jgi:diguanylate cyclase (GGDEF)-like protein
MASKSLKPGTEGASRARRTGDRQTARGTGAKALESAEILAEGLSPEARAALARVLGENEAMRRELAEARKRIAHLERLADEDALAPVANRRAFVRELSRMIAFTRRYGSPSSVVYFDVNDLKQINDTYGHPAGDAALRHIAEVLCKNVRSSDVVGRLGGDEFGVILAQTSQEQAASKASTLASAIATSPFFWGKSEISVSAAYGVYSFTGSDDAQAAIETADKAMYQQKRVARRA